MRRWLLRVFGYPPSDDGWPSPKWIAYRWLMRFAHRYHWHYAPPIYPDGDTTQLWCKWCGFRQTIKREDRSPLVCGVAEQGKGS